MLDLLTKWCDECLCFRMGLVLGLDHSHSGSHGSHGHSHHKRSPSSTSSVKENDKGQNLNVRAAFIHVLGDLLQSVVVFIAAVIIKFKVIVEIDSV